MGSAWGFGAETAIHAIRLLCSGIFDELPTAKLILGHLGEGLPFGLPPSSARLNNQKPCGAHKKPLTEYMEKNTILPVKVEGVVNGGVIVMVEGLRGFVPASKLSLSYIEDLETYLLKEIEVRVIDVDSGE